MNPTPEQIQHRGECDHVVGTHTEKIRLKELENRMKLKQDARDFQKERSAIRKEKGLKPRAYSRLKE